MTLPADLADFEDLWGLWSEGFLRLRTAGAVITELAASVAPSASDVAEPDAAPPSPLAANAAIEHMAAPLTTEEDAAVDAAWSHGDGDDNVVCSLAAGAGGSSVDILGKHFGRLRKAWLFDESVNAYMFLLQERERTSVQQTRAANLLLSLHPSSSKKCLRAGRPGMRRYSVGRSGSRGKMCSTSSGL